MFNDDDPATWADADAAAPEIVSLGPVRFRIIDADAVDLAVALPARPNPATRRCACASSSTRPTARPCLPEQAKNEVPEKLSAGAAESLAESQDLQKSESEELLTS